MWPFTADTRGLWLVMYILTFALHAVFVGYVLAGTVYALVQAVRKADDAIAARVRDRLPFMLGLGITAGVAPLLFLQLLYQRHFYSANLIAGPRWGAVVPALILGFYALYFAKAKERWRRHALAVGAACFLFVAWSWTELHLLARDEAAWRAMYSAGDRLYGEAGVAPRLLLWLGWMTVLFAAVAMWSASIEQRRRLAAIALAGRFVTAIAASWLYARGGMADAHGWLYLLGAALAVELAGWIAILRAPAGIGVMLATGGATAALVAGAVVREAPRIALLEPPRPAALEAGGFPMFASTVLFGIAAIAWVVKTVRTAPPE
jgi:hypothetical protein